MSKVDKEKLEKKKLQTRKRMVAMRKRKKDNDREEVRGIYASAKHAKLIKAYADSLK